MVSVWTTTLWLCVCFEQDAPEDRVRSRWDPRTPCQWQPPSQKPSMPTSKAPTPASTPKVPCDEAEIGSNFALSDKSSLRSNELMFVFSLVPPLPVFQVCCESHRGDGTVLPRWHNQALFQPPDPTSPHLQHQQLQPAGAGAAQPTAAVLVRRKGRTRTQKKRSTLGWQNDTNNKVWRD